MRTRSVVGLAALLLSCGSSQSSTSRLPMSKLVSIPGGTFTMGDARYASKRPDESPRRVTVQPFQLMRFEVTNEEFAAFVAATRHATHPERNGWGYVWTGRWRRVKGADWRHPYGPDSDITGRGNHPVVQVSVEDAAAYCLYRGMRLPSEAEWEFAAKGTDGRRFPWGDESPQQDGVVRRANFGTVPCCAPDETDGYRNTAPVSQYPAGVSPFGVHDMAGNVWEWTRDEFPGRPGTAALRGGGWGNTPYCLRTSYRHANRRDVGRDHIGIRCARDG